MRATEEVGVSIRGIYQGYALQQVDEKGRVASQPNDSLAELGVREASDRWGWSPQVVNRTRNIALLFDLESGRMTRAGERKLAIRNTENPIPDREVLLVVCLHRKSAIQPSHHGSGFAGVDTWQCL